MAAKFQDKGDKDLFEQAQTTERKIKKGTRLLLNSAKKSLSLSYENIIFLIIAFVMSSIIFFSLGVEKGRRDIGYLGTRGEEKGERIQNSEQKIQDKYIIQLAAFKKAEPAKQELARLKKDGYKADIKKSGDYYQVYIGGFTQERNAQKLIKKLKENYEDCYIKKVSEDTT